MHPLTVTPRTCRERERECLFKRCVSSWCSCCASRANRYFAPADSTNWKGNQGSKTFLMLAASQHRTSHPGFTVRRSAPDRPPPHPPAAPQVRRTVGCRSCISRRSSTRWEFCTNFVHSLLTASGPPICEGSERDAMDDDRTRGHW